MITVNDKLKLFSKRVVDRRQKQYDDKVIDLEEQMLNDLHERKSMLEKDRSKYEITLLKGIKAEQKQRLSNARSEKKRRLLLKRKNMIEVLLKGVQDYTRDFVQTDDYFDYLQQTCLEHKEEIQGLGEFDVYVNAEDYKKLKGQLSKLFKSLGFQCRDYKIYNQKIIGGMVLLKTDGKSRIDMSLDSVIEDNRTYMGQLIYGILEEAGEVYER